MPITECKKEKPLVSVIIPVYNAERYILKCVHSVLDSSYRNIELIIINDGSLDNTLSMLQKDERLSIWGG